MGDSQGLASQLLSMPEREKTGSDIASRYEFQTFWGLALLFQHHGSAANYAIVFEFHDDVALFDDPVSPLKVRFYQVKSKATVGGWTLESLIGRKKSISKKTKDELVKPSHIDKMYVNIEKFDPNVLSVEFVSNQHCHFNATASNFSFQACGQAEFQKIVKSVQEVYPGATEAQIGLLGFRKTDLSLPDAVSHIKGKLHQFICDQIGAVTFNLETLYKAIIDDCRRKAAFTGAYADFAEVVRHKGVTKDDVQTWLNTIVHDQRAPDWIAIMPLLTGYTFLENRRIGQQYDIIRSAVLNPGDAALFRVRTAIRKAIAELDPNTPEDLCQIIDTICASCQDVAQKYLAPYSPDKLKAMIAYELHTND